MPRFIIQTADGKQIFKSNVLNVAYGGSVTLAAEQAVNGDVTLTIAASAGAGTPSATVEDETTWGITPAAGASTNYSRGDHTHGSPTAPGAGDVATDVIWDAAGDLAVGTGANAAARLPITVPAANILEVLGVVNGETTATWKAAHDSTAPSTQAFGDSALAGTALTASHRDHKHAMPADPVTAHEGAADPHTGYQKESEKDAASGYVGLDASTIATFQKDTNATHEFRVRNDDVTGSARVQMSLWNAVEKAVIGWVLSDLSMRIINRVAGSILFYTNNGGPRMTIDSTGNVSVATGTILTKPSGTAGIQLDPNAATGNFTGSLSPANLTGNRRWTFPDRDLTVGAVPDPNQQSYSPGSFTLSTEKYVILSRHLKLTTTQRATLQGTGTLRIA
jgi:hypothetical protein